MQIVNKITLAFLFPVVAGCAGLEMQPVNDDAADKNVTGFRYYETSPFLLISTDNAGGLKSQIIYLPDLAKKRSIRPYSWLASNKTTLTFKDGGLLGAKAEVDETAIPSAVISSLEKVASSVVKAMNKDDQIPGPFLFRIVQNGKGNWSLEGDRARGVDEKGYSSIRYKGDENGEKTN